MKLSYHVETDDSLVQSSFCGTEPGLSIAIPEGEYLQRGVGSHAIADGVTVLPC